MTINYDKIQAAVKVLGSVTDNDAFLEGFLSAFNFPKATYNRLKSGAKAGTNLGFRIQGNGGIYFLASTAENLNSEFNILKKNDDLRKIKEAFIIIVNNTDVLAYERESADVLEASKRDLYRYIEFFFSLLGIRPEAAPDEMKSADKKAAEKFAILYYELSIRNNDCSDDISELLCRLLFCCFSDNIGVLTNGGLRPLVMNYTDESGSDMSAFFNNLFEAMKSELRGGLPGYFSNVKCIDTRLFGEAVPLLDFSKKARSLVLDLMALDWSDISPDILGALIQSIVRKTVRHLSNNYTSTANIQKVIGPLFMNELYYNFELVKTSRAGCEALLSRIKAISVFDPSSGTGNFLLVAFKELSKLAGKIADVIEDLDSANISGDAASSPQMAEKVLSFSCEPLISWSNFYGIDDDAFSCSIARLGFLFVICQEARDRLDVRNVFANEIDVLFASNIVIGNATRINWELVCSGSGETYLIGNPTYSGGSKKSDEQKSDIDYVFAGYRGYSNLDYAACWFMLATKYICSHDGGFAFVTTNSLTQGEQVQLLWPKLFENGVRIRFAYTAFKWKNDARNRTAVTVVVIGIVPSTNHQSPELYTSGVVLEPRSISPYLVPGNAIVSGRTTPISYLPKMLKGNMPYQTSTLLFNYNEMMTIVASDQRSKKFIRKTVGAHEFIQGIDRWCLWIQDDDYDEAMSIPMIKARIDKVRSLRLASADPAVKRLANRPHQFREMRETHTQSLVVPAVSSENYIYIPIGFIGKDTIVTNLASIIYDCEPWIFGVVSSRMHNVWAKTVCGRHEVRPRYSLELGYNTFPFPKITQEQRSLIQSCVLGIIRVREQFAPKTLAQLYKVDQTPTDLMAAHSLLDKVIENCYRQTPFVSDQERIESLFDLYNKLEDKTNGKYYKNQL